MKTFVGLFLSSGTFGASIAVVYWFSSHEPAGTFLLGFMTLAFAWAAIYSIIAESGTNLAGDDPDLQHKERAGEDVGIVTKATPWPMLLALSIFWTLLGVVWSDFLLLSGIAAMLLCLWRLGAESARAGTKRVMTEEGPIDAT